MNRTQGNKVLRREITLESVSNDFDKYYFRFDIHVVMFILHFYIQIQTRDKRLFFSFVCRYKSMDILYTPSFYEFCYVKERFYYFEGYGFFTYI